MKTQNQSKIRNLYGFISGCLRLALKTLRHKFAVKRESFQSFPKEAPH